MIASFAVTDSYFWVAAPHGTRNVKFDAVKADVDLSRMRRLQNAFHIVIANAAANEDRDAGGGLLDERSNHFEGIFRLWLSARCEDSVRAGVNHFF